MTNLDAVGVVIPSLEPERELLLPFLERLRAIGFRHIILIDDGSPESSRPIFDAAERDYGCTVLVHPVNMGKGRALKTGFEHCAQVPGLRAIVTADSDGQHAAADLAKVAERVLTAGPRTAVFGVRDFTGAHVPKNSRRGNHITSRVVQVLFGQYLSDTQTGLRGFSIDLARDSAEVRGERFEYEMNVVLWLMGTHCRIEEVPIETIYHDITNTVSHFRPVKDSARIYGVIFKQFFKFVFSSLVGSGIDFLLYTLIAVFVFHSSHAFWPIAVATVGARVVSSLVNFLLNRNAVFEDHSNPRRAMSRYYTLVVVLLVLSALGSYVFTQITGGHLVWAKFITDAVLFVVSYLVQKRWVFRDDSLRERE